MNVRNNGEADNDRKRRLLEQAEHAARDTERLANPYRPPRQLLTIQTPGECHAPARTKGPPPGQAALASLPTVDPAACIAWETHTAKYGKGDAAETWEYYQTTCKGHTFKVGLISRDCYIEWPTKPPSQW